MLTDSGFYDYCGAIHIHSKHSDGTGTLKKIVKVAQNAGLDYIIITDHNTIKTMEDGGEGWYDDLLTLVGEEIGQYGDSHYLAFGINQVINPEDHENINSYIQAVKKQGGIGFAAHPIGINKPIFDLHLSSWKDWDNPDYTGMEIWSYMRDWAGNINLFSIFYYFFRPEKAIRGPNPELLEKWDQLCQKRRIAAIGGVDVHARHFFPFIFIQFLSYRKAFRGLRNHIITKSPLSSDLIESKKIIYGAMEAGNCFFARDFLRDSRGFSFMAYTDKGQRLIMGDEVKLESGARLEIKSPARANLRLLCNGQLISEVSDARELVFKTTKPGVYRVEAYLGKFAWVFTNPIYLRNSDHCSLR